MNKGEKELVQLTTQWLEKIEAVTVSYTKAISKLDNTREAFEKQTYYQWRFFFTYVLPPLSPFIIILALILALQVIGCGKIEVGSIKIQKDCSIQDSSIPSPTPTSYQTVQPSLLVQERP